MGFGGFDWYRSARAEQAKCRLVKHAIKQSAQSYIELLKLGLEVFQAQLELAETIPENSDEPMTLQGKVTCGWWVQILKIALLLSSLQVLRCNRSPSFWPTTTLTFDQSFCCLLAANPSILLASSAGQQRG